MRQGKNKKDIQEQIWSPEFLSLVQNTEWLSNLETSITYSQSRWPNKTFNFKVLPLVANQLLPQEMVAVNLANNHILDYRQEGLIYTLHFLDEHNIGHAGAGLDIKEAQTPFIWKTSKSISIGLIGAGDHPREFFASENKGGINYLLTNVQTTVKKVDILIVYLHIGANWQHSVDPKTIDLAHLLIDFGCKVVCITSPHHLMPMELYGGGVIFYSLGDQLDDYAIDQNFRNDLTVLAQVDFSPGRGLQKVLLYPMKISNLSLQVLDPIQDKVEYDLVLSKLNIQNK